MAAAEIVKRLLIKISEGDEVSFTKLYDLLFLKVFNFAGCFIQSEESREEIVSDVFVTLWQNRRKLPEIAKLDAYLFILTRNKSVDYLDRYKQSPAYLSEVSFEIAEDKNTPEHHLLYSELEGLIEKSINDLPSRCKLIFLMSRDEGLTYKEIAEILSLSESTVNGQMVIAIKKLGETLRKYLHLILFIG